MTGNRSEMVERPDRATVLKFLNHAFRNIDLPRLSPDDLGDIADGLRSYALATPNQPLSDDVLPSEHPLFEPICREIERSCPYVSAGMRGFLAARIILLAAIPSAGGVEEPSDAMIEVGCEAMHKIHAAMRDRNLSDEPETMDDFDEGDVCRAVYHAMRRAALGGDPSRQGAAAMTGNRSEMVERAILDRLREDDGTPYTQGFNNGVRAANVAANQALGGGR